MLVHRDPFARGGYERTCVAAAKDGRSCDWCGQRPKRLFSYAWIADDRQSPSIHERHTASHLFCGFDCFRSYFS